jgi:hypothetical protein
MKNEKLFGRLITKLDRCGRNPPGQKRVRSQLLAARKSPAWIMWQEWRPVCRHKSWMLKPEPQIKFKEQTSSKVRFILLKTYYLWFLDISIRKWKSFRVWRCSPALFAENLAVVFTSVIWAVPRLKPSSRRQHWTLTTVDQTVMAKRLEYSNRQLVRPKVAVGQLFWLKKKLAKVKIQTLWIKILKRQLCSKSFYMREQLILKCYLGKKWDASSEAYDRCDNTRYCRAFPMRNGFLRWVLFFLQCPQFWRYSHKR